MNTIKKMMFVVLFMFGFGVPTTEIFASDSSIIDTETLEYMNTLRTNAGLQPLVISDELSEIAEVRASEASIKWSHVRPDGTDAVNMITAPVGGENLAMTIGLNEKEAAQQMNHDLRGSRTHYENIVWDEVSKIGIATKKSNTNDGTKYVTAFIFSN